jgi:hypothetical protein
MENIVLDGFLYMQNFMDKFLYNIVFFRPILQLLQLSQHYYKFKMYSNW